MAKNANADVVALLEALGVTQEQARAALGVTQVASRKTIQVDLTEGEALKYGDVAISKVTSNGRSIPKLGVFADDLPGLIADLTAAQEALAS